MTALSRSRPFPTPPWYGALWNMLLLLGNQQRLERVQRRAARFWCGDYTNRTPGCDMLKVLHWESLEARRKNNRLSLLHKINTGHVDVTLDQYLQRSVPCVFDMQGQTTQPFIIHLFMQHIDSGIGSPQAYQPPHAQRLSELAFGP